MTTFSPTMSFWVTINVYGNRLRHDDRLCPSLLWDNMTMDMRKRWAWYFEYRAALLKVKYPKALVEMNWGASEAKDTTRLHILQKQLSSKKGQYTKAMNKLQAYEQEYRENIFASQTMAIDDYLPGYAKALEKLEKKRGELDALLQEIESYKDEINQKPPDQ